MVKTQTESNEQNRKPSLKKLLTALVCAVSLSFLTGCIALAAGAAAGAGGAYYFTSDVETTEAVSIDKAWSATLAALQDLDLVGGSKEKDLTFAYVEADGPDDKKVRIRLDSENDNVTKIKVRVGIIADEAFAERVLDRIKSRL